MTNRMSYGERTDSVPSQDDWRNINSVMEKKKAQNRLAQRNYRRNVKRKIEELEQQVATQAKLLAQEGEAAKNRTQGISSLADSDSPSSMDETLATSTEERQKDVSAPLPTPASQLFGTPEDFSPSDGYLDTLWDCSAQGYPKNNWDNLHVDMGARVTDRAPKSTQVQKHPPYPASTTQSTDLDLDTLHDVHSGSPIGSFRVSDEHGRSRRAEDQWCGLARRNNSSDMVKGEALLTDDEAMFEQTTEERITYLIRCARRAGFQDLDSAVTTLYTAKFDEDSECSIAQHFSRKRCLPNLLEELRSKTNSWKAREVQPYQDEVLKSAESLLIGEMRSRQAVALHKILAGLLPNDASSRSSANSHQLRDEVSVVSNTTR
ncbi:hypothetical protein CERZMDRAFT_111191 [Cercospora zeae-maydis SCOH1-5]|uniref:BZIP domain-containing protein n=1 Tax=Cercospora zeae-maydis SCOH1-5 TaxID=717836 RepID=A0A6A6FJE2_9PEZI|nr:hypothetical protein CERZMDRAFT_111191 [Cercospora zeae-maydis SCOH1-5]